jgi:hypothetical protein
MATTTNYSWTTPDDTALVKDGAAAIRSLGTAIDTTVFNNAGAAIAKTIVDAKGDIIAATAADTVSRLAVGANDTVLTADSTQATGLKWAAVAGGGMTLLSTTTLSGATVSLSSIPGTYNSLKLILFGATWGTANGLISLRPNGSSANFTYGAVRSGTAIGRTSTEFWFVDNNMLRTGGANVFSFDFDNYASTSSIKPVNYSGRWVSDTNNTPLALVGGGGWNDTSAITSIDIYVEGYSFSGGTALLYGVK